MPDIDNNVRMVSARIEAGDEVVVTQPSRKRVLRFNPADGGYLLVRKFQSGAFQHQSEETMPIPDRESLQVAVAEALYE